MSILQSVLLRTTVWVSCVVTFLVVGWIGSTLAEKNEIYTFWTIIIGLFVIFLAQGLASLIPTRREIKQRRQVVGG